MASDKGFPGINGDSGAAGEKDFATLADIVEKINQRYGTQFKPAEQVPTLRKIAGRVAAKDRRLGDLKDKKDAGTWNMVYDSVSASGVAEAKLGNADFFALVQKADALDHLKGLMRETVRELAAVNAASGM